MRSLYLAWAAGLSLALTAGCGRPAPDVAAPSPALVPTEAKSAPRAPAQTRFFAGRARVELADRQGGPVIQVELARTEAEREHGLMFRRQMPDDHGMLFLMPRDQDWVFYMRNTYLRLDMVFIDRDWRVVGIIANVPPLTEDHRGVGAESRYVLELTAHSAARLGIQAGTRLHMEPLPDDVPAPEDP